MWWYSIYGGDSRWDCWRISNVGLQLVDALRSLVPDVSPGSRRVCAYTFSISICCFTYKSLTHADSIGCSGLPLVRHPHLVRLHLPAVIGSKPLLTLVFRASLPIVVWTLVSLCPGFSRSRVATSLSSRRKPCLALTVHQGANWGMVVLAVEIPPVRRRVSKGVCGLLAAGERSISDTRGSAEGSSRPLWFVTALGILLLRWPYRRPALD